jgi:hypothetical protein
MEGLLEVSLLYSPKCSFQTKSETSRVKWQTDAAWEFKQQQVCNFSELPARDIF